MDPTHVRLSLIPAFSHGETWSIARVDRDVTVALDAGQFRRTLPFGWVVSGGHEMLPAEQAPLAGAVVVTHDGHLRIVAPDSVLLERGRGAALEAFQSYPLLLQNGELPPPLRHPGNYVDLEHRDARLALGTLADGRVVIALTRSDALGPSFGRVPLGLTTPEMAAVMGALGCRHALMLDGGHSRSWPGIRSVPLGLVAKPLISR